VEHTENKTFDTPAVEQETDLLSLTADIVASHVSNNSMESEQLPDFIQSVYDTLITLKNKKGFYSGKVTPAIAVEESITDDYIVCLEDGKKLKMLKRHLRTAYNMTPDEYREKWGLTPDYPMVAPNYAKQRSSLAKDIGLGTRPRKKNVAKAA